MKKLIIIITALIISIPILSFCKEKKIEVPPQKVKETFNRLYGGVPANWTLEGNNYEAEFVSGMGNKVTIVIDKNGKFIDKEYAIKESELPKPALEYVKKKYKAYKITEITKITPQIGIPDYEIEVTKGAQKYDLIFDKDGKFKKKMKNNDNK